MFNAPPRDAWFAFAADDLRPAGCVHELLVPYVPPVFLDACAAGIAVNPEECIKWIKDADVAFGDLLWRHAAELLWSV